MSDGSPGTAAHPIPASRSATDATLRIPLAFFPLPLVLALVCPVPAAANGDISKVKHPSENAFCFRESCE